MQKNIIKEKLMKNLKFISSDYFNYYTNEKELSNEIDYIVDDIDFKINIENIENINIDIIDVSDYIINYKIMIKFINQSILEFNDILFTIALKYKVHKESGIVIEIQ